MASFSPRVSVFVLASAATWPALTSADPVETATVAPSQPLVAPPPASSPGPSPSPSSDAPSSDVVVDASWGRGISFRSASGTFSLQLRGRVQGLIEASGLGGEGEPTLLAAVRRARLTFTGHLGRRDVQFYVQLGLAPQDMEPDLLVPLRDASIAWTGLRDLNLRFGQMKVPFNRERVIGSSSLALVDRSIVNAELTLDRDLGLMASSSDLFGLGGVLAYQVGVFDGNGRNRPNVGPGLLYVARLQLQPTGRFDDSYSMSDFTRADTLRVSIGLGGAFNHRAQRARSTTGAFYALGGFDQAHAEADLMLKYKGLSIQAEALLRVATDGAPRTGTVDGEALVERARSGFGWFAQAGYLFPYPIELVARFSRVTPLGADSALPTSHELTGGVNWFVERHDLKLQADVSHLSGEAFADARVRVRVQAQAAF
jgi:phosphate-selective porin OprO/OprP